MTWPEFALALLGSNALTAFVTHWFERRQRDGAVVESFAHGAELVSQQNVQLLRDICESRLEASKLREEIVAVKIEIKKLQLALGRDLTKAEGDESERLAGMNVP